MRKESYQIKRPEHLVIGDPWYFETVDSQKLKSLVIDVIPQKEFAAALTIEETEYDECMTNIIFALEILLAAFSWIIGIWKIFRTRTQYCMDIIC